MSTACVNRNPYSPPLVVFDRESGMARRVFRIAFQTQLFVLGFVVGVQVDLLLELGLHDTIVTFTEHNWLWNNAVRLPSLAVIQLVLIVLYLRTRSAGRDTYTPTLIGLLPLGWISGSLNFRLYDWIRMVPEEMFGATITWTPHFMIWWAAYGVTTVAIVEVILALRWCVHKNRT